VSQILRLYDKDFGKLSRWLTENDLIGHTPFKTGDLIFKRKQLFVKKSSNETSANKRFIQNDS